MAYPAWLLAVLALVLGTWSLGQTTVAGVCGSHVPRAVEGLVATTFPSWRITDLSDLTSEDRTLWERRRGKECPGFVTGQFIQAHKDSHAALLVQTREGEVRQKLVILEREDATYKMRVLWEGTWASSDRGRMLVIWRVGPGRHWKADRSSSVVTELDSIALEAIEARVTMYYWNKNTFRSLDLQI
jgi:hypothetical protein